MLYLTIQFHFLEFKSLSLNVKWFIISILNDLDCILYYNKVYYLKYTKMKNNTLNLSPRQSKSTIIALLGLALILILNLSLPALVFGRNGSDSTLQMIRLHSFNNNTPSYFDETIIYFDTNGTVGYNPNDDAFKLLNTYKYYPNIYTISEQDMYAVKALPLLNDTAVTMSLGFNASITGTYQINATEIDNFPANTNIYLMDNVENITQNLMTNPSYTFSFNSGTVNNRFSIKFSPVSMTTSIVKSQQLPVTSCQIYADGSKLNVVYNNLLNEIGGVYIYNLAGQNMVIPQHIKNGSYQFILNNGVYIVKLISGNNVTTKKIYINN